MDKTRFTSPNGSLVRSPSLNDIVGLIQTKGEDFWNSHDDTGFATLEYYRGDQRIACLIFTKKDGYGFHMKFVEQPDQQGSTRNYLSVGNDNYDDVVEVNLCESPIWLPRAFFIDEELAEQVIRLFFQGGERHQRGIWIPTTELNWDLIEGRKVE